MLLWKRKTPHKKAIIPHLVIKIITSVIGMTGPGAWMLLTFNPPKNETKNNNSSSNSSTPTPSPTSCQPHSSVMLICDKNYPDGQFRLGYYDKDICLYVFELRIAAICDENSGMSGFSIFLIILVVAFALYFICGVLYNRTQLGSKGIDQIPNRRFWFGLGNKFAYCSETEHLDNHSQYSGGYSPIGETAGGKPPGMASSSPGYERDSQLISP
ncbi:Cation-dependent mannose-6-phosphate receptor [Armadillidium vulgare]|nr:Cation-dependent mannose-6-phosphate receptor [Armadillidium vulgare]